MKKAGVYFYKCENCNEKGTETYQAIDSSGDISAFTACFEADGIVPALQIQL